MRLALWGEIPRAVVIDHLLWLASEEFEREPGVVWDVLATDCVDFQAVELLPELRRAYDDGLINPDFVSWSEIEEMERTPPGERVRKTAARHPRIDDVAVATAWWDRSEHAADDEDDVDLLEDEFFEDEDGFFEEEVEPFQVQQPYRAPPKIGRNEPCPCGSGKKYKKCHGG